MSYGTDKPENCVPAADREPERVPPGARDARPGVRLSNHPVPWKRGGIGRAVTRARRQAGFHPARRGRAPRGGWRR
jgi:hypothetical protein